MSSLARRVALVVPLVMTMAGCGGGAAPTPIVIYVTPVPTTAAVAATPLPTISPQPTPQPTPPPTPRPTPRPTPEPTPEPTEEPISYPKLSNRQWAKVVKNPDAYLGRGYTLWGCISQFDAATGPDSFRAQASNRKEDYWYSDGENAYFIGDEDRLSDFVADDLVYMKVLSMGSFSYDTTIGGSITVPMFSVVSLSRKGDCS